MMGKSWESTHLLESFMRSRAIFEQPSLDYYYWAIYMLLSQFKRITLFQRDGNHFHLHLEGDNKANMKLELTAAGHIVNPIDYIAKLQMREVCKFLYGLKWDLTFSYTSTVSNFSKTSMASSTRTRCRCPPQFISGSNLSYRDSTYNPSRLMRLVGRWKIFFVFWKNKKFQILIDEGFLIHCEQWPRMPDFFSIANEIFDDTGANLEFRWVFNCSAEF